MAKIIISKKSCVDLYANGPPTKVYKYHLLFPDYLENYIEKMTFWHNWGDYTLVYDFEVCYIVFKRLYHRKYCENCFFASL